MQAQVRDCLRTIIPHIVRHGTALTPVLGRPASLRPKRGPRCRRTHVAKWASANRLFAPKQYGSLEPDQARGLQQSQEENAWLKKLVAGFRLDKAIFPNIIQKMTGPALRVPALDYV